MAFYFHDYNFESLFAVMVYLKQVCRHLSRNRIKCRKRTTSQGKRTNIAFSWIVVSSVDKQLMQTEKKVGNLFQLGRSGMSDHTRIWH